MDEKIYLNRLFQLQEQDIFAKLICDEIEAIFNKRTICFHPLESQNFVYTIVLIHLN